MKQRLIVGLGNPGQAYAGTRHNAGFLLLDRLVDRLGATLVPATGPSVLWRGEHAGSEVLLMKPLTYMNLSGEALAKHLAAHPLPVEHTLIVYDDVALPLGVLRARPSGSAGGQKGMRHIIDCLGTREIPRLRIGIDSEHRGGMPLPDFVLADFEEDELPLIRSALDAAEDAAVLWLESDMTRVMAAFNARRDPGETQTCESLTSIDGHGGER